MAGENASSQPQYRADGELGRSQVTLHRALLTKGILTGGLPIRRRVPLSLQNDNPYHHAHRLVGPCVWSLRGAPNSVRDQSKRRVECPAIAQNWPRMRRRRHAKGKLRSAGPDSELHHFRAMAIGYHFGAHLDQKEGYRVAFARGLRIAPEARR
jgi:hypothetical protein